MTISGSSQVNNIISTEKEIKIKPENIEKKDVKVENSKAFENIRSSNNLLVSEDDLEELSSSSEINNSKIGSLLNRIESQEDKGVNKFKTSLNVDSRDLLFNNLNLQGFLDVSDESLKNIPIKSQQKIFEDAKSDEFREKSNDVVVKFLNKNNLTRHDIGDDGNCFFYSIEKGLKNLSKPQNIDYNSLRDKACKYIEKNPNQFLELEPNYLKDMKKDKTYADSEVIRALSKDLGRPIVIINTGYNKETSQVNLEPMVYNHSSKEEPIFILRKNENHFELITANDKLSKEYKDLVETVNKYDTTDSNYEEFLGNNENVLDSVQMEVEVIEQTSFIDVPKKPRDINQINPSSKEDLTPINNFVNGLKDKEPREQLDKITKKINETKSPGALNILNQKRDELIFKYFGEFQTGISTDNIKSLIKNFKEATAHKGMFKTDRLVKPIYNALENLEKALGKNNNDDKINALVKVNKEINSFMKSHGKESTRTEWVKVLQNVINVEMSNVSDDLFNKNIDAIKNIKKGDKISVKDNNFVLQKSGIGQGLTRSKNNDKRDDLKDPIENMMNILKDKLNNNRIKSDEYISVYKGLENLSKSYDNKFAPLNKILNDFKIENNVTFKNNLENRINNLQNDLKGNFEDYKKNYELLKKDVSLVKSEDLNAKMKLLSPEKVRFLPVFKNIEIENGNIKVKNETQYSVDYNKTLENEFRKYISNESHNDFKIDDKNTCEIFQKDFNRGKTLGQYTFINLKSETPENINIKDIETFNKSLNEDPKLVYLMSRISNQAFMGTISELAMNNPNMAFLNSVDNSKIMPLTSGMSIKYNFIKVDDDNFYLNINGKLKQDGQFMSISAIDDPYKNIIGININVEQDINIKVSKKENNWGFSIDKNELKYEISNFNVDNL